MELTRSFSRCACRCSRSPCAPARWRRSDSSPSHRRPRPSSRACSSTCCRSSSRRPASRCASSRSARARRSTSARRGDADVVFVHAKSAEENSSPKATACKRFPVMYNDFVLIGPRSDPGEDRRRKRHADALQQDQGGAARRSSRAATAAARTWPRSTSGKRPASTSTKEKGPWYRETGQGMGPALNTAASMNAYSLPIAHLARVQEPRRLAILVEGDKRLLNQYGVMLVNPEKHPHVKTRRGPSVHRLARLAGRPGGDRRVRDRRRAAVLPERRRARRLSRPFSAVRERCAATRGQVFARVDVRERLGALEEHLARAEPFEHLPRRRMSATGQGFADRRQRRDRPQRAERLAAFAGFGHRRAALGALEQAHVEIVRQQRRVARADRERPRALLFGPDQVRPSRRPAVPTHRPPRRRASAARALWPRPPPRSPAAR